MDLFLQLLGYLEQLKGKLFIRHDALHVPQLSDKKIFDYVITIAQKVQNSFLSLVERPHYFP